jgi:anthranilate/para-aminobenzoate synthase component I
LHRPLWRHVVIYTIDRQSGSRNFDYFASHLPYPAISYGLCSQFRLIDFLLWRLYCRGMSPQDTLYKPALSSRMAPVAGQTPELRQWFAPFAGKFGSVFLESSLSAYGRGGRTFAAVNPVDSWTIEPNQAIPADWMRQLDSFLGDESAFYALFFSYEFGSELVAGLPSISNGANKERPGKECHTEYKALALKYSEVKIDSDYHECDSQDSTGRLARTQSKAETTGTARLVSRPDRARYLQDHARIKSHIHEGDIYQANLTAEWQIESDASPWDVYRRLHGLNPCQYGGFANLGAYTILSSSPERLVSVEGRMITANPIKGTITKGESAEQTENNLSQLLSSEKDRAELLMIVDLLRNDLGKVCQTGSVQTPVIWRPEIYSSVIHLVAEIKGELRPEVSTAEVINATFPGGSITGAPKRRAIRILRDIENRSRGIYTGSIGYKYGSELDLNIAIRTLTYVPFVQRTKSGESVDGLYHAQAGGGIVADSVAESEFAEAALKVANLLKAIEPELLP